ncbi:hypothetical protein C3L23_02460 [Nautilia sp. PV-1]|uniref:porin n=1 Tax=Nautilia sp. PV-1 TaxID=2579250 RepID=UPI000FD6E02D|nr:major outer membrane protein [Nautilia sp. PV-1]AZV46171.1 hypothetical protein C3L23_02460 [Nautilia sp. PV-1]
MLKKLSLAALIAMGSMSVASATPLTEAIKGVDLNGMLRVRYYHEMPKDQNSYNRWRTNAILIFSVPVSEELKLVVRNSVQTNVYTDDDTLNPNGTSSSAIDDSIANNLLFLKYSSNGVNAILGKIPVKTSITSADPATPGHGAGAVATYTVNKNLTVGAAYVDALKTGGDKLANDIYAGVAVFDAGVVKGNFWAYHITNYSKAIYTLSLSANPVEGVSVQADYGHGKNDTDHFANVKSSSYFDVVASAKQDAFCATLGYAYHNDGNSVIVTSADAPFGNVIPTANNYNIAGADYKVSSVFAKLGYNVDAKTSVFAAYQHQNDKSTDNNDLNEYTVGGSYAYTKKMSFSAYYDYADFKVNTDDNGEFRFQALYKF